MDFGLPGLSLNQGQRAPTRIGLCSNPLRKVISNGNPNHQNQLNTHSKPTEKPRERDNSLAEPHMESRRPFRRPGTTRTRDGDADGVPAPLPPLPPLPAARSVASSRWTPLGFHLRCEKN